MDINWENLSKEFVYTTARSGGSGGQHVNKVETKVIVSFDIEASQVLTTEEKEIISAYYKKRLGRSTKLSMYCQATRSQLKNKERVTKNFLRLIKKSFVVQKRRVPTKKPKAVKDKIRADKKIRSKVKALRKKPRLD